MFKNKDELVGNCITLQNVEINKMCFLIPWTCTLLQIAITQLNPTILLLAILKMKGDKF